MKKLVAMLLAVAMMATTFAGCSSSTATTETASTAATTTEEAAAETATASSGEELTIWVEKYFSDEANALTENRILQYAEETGTTVNYEFIAATDYQTKLNAAIEAGTLPDVAVSSAAKTLSYYPNNPYMDITDLVAEVNETSPMLDAVVTGSQVEGSNYFMPYNGSSAIFFVRQDLLDAQGLEIPTTWDEVFDVAVKISDPDNGIYGLGIGCGPTDEDCENTFRTIMWNSGTSVLNADGSSRTEADPILVDLVQTYADLYAAEAIAPAATTWDSGGNNKSYLLGESAMVFNAPTLWTALQDADYAELLANTTVVESPAGSSGNEVMEFIYGWAIMEDADNVEGASDFIKYMMEESWYQEYITSVAPVFSSVFKSSQEESFWMDSPINSKILAYNAQATGYYGYPVSNTADRAAVAKNYYSFPIATMLTSVVTGDKTAEEAVLALYASVDETKATMQ